MAGWLTVLVDTKEYVRVVRLREGHRGSLNLTTMLPDQDRALVEVAFQGNRSFEHGHTFHLRGLRGGAERPRIAISATVRDPLTVDVTLEVDGTATERCTLRAPEAVSTPNTAAWMIALLALITAAALGAWALFGGAESITGTPPDRRAFAIDLPERHAPPPRPPLPGSGPESESAVELDRPREYVVLFDPDSSIITPRARESIERIVREIDQVLGSSNARLAVRVVGHTALFGSERSRVQLSSDRAQVVAGRIGVVTSTRVEMEIRGAGGSTPLTRLVEEQWRNRRVEVVVGLR